MKLFIKNYIVKLISYRLILSTMITISSLFIESFGGGTIKNITFYSNSLKQNRKAQIYLPEGYNQQDTTIRYPVVYYLHGWNAYGGFSNLYTVLDNLIKDKKISPVIVVLPDGGGGFGNDSHYTNSIVNGNFEDYIVNDLIKFIDTLYNTISSREKRSIMGHSMGGYGSMKLVLKHPDIYSSVASHSGLPLDFDNLNYFIKQVLNENGKLPVKTYNPNAGTYSLLLWSAAYAFSPNPGKSPYKADIPLDSMGNWIDSVKIRWQLHDPIYIASKLTQNLDLSIYFDCGLQDSICYPAVKGFADSLKKLGIPYEFQSFKGGHSDQLSYRFPIALKFLDSVMNKKTSFVDNSQNKNIPQKFILYQNYPNPFNPSTVISYQLPVNSKVSLKVYDILGNEVATLVNEEKPAGTYEVEFDGGNLTSGIYFYQLKAGNHIESRKMILMK